MKLAGGSVVRIAGGAVALLLTAIALGGCVESVPRLSETCTQPSTLVDAFAADRNVFVRVGAQPSPDDPNKTWICFRARAGAADQGGRIDVKTAGAVTTDADSRACATAPGNRVPGPHPIEAGAVLDVPFHFDAFLGSDALWLCVEVGSLKQRVIVPLAAGPPPTGLPVIDVRTDSALQTPQDTTPPPAGRPSSSCHEGTYGPSHELLNAHLDGRDQFLYSAQPSAGELHLCARISAAGLERGGRLSVTAPGGGGVQLEQSADTAPCTVNVLTLSNPPTSIMLTPAGQSPPSICVQGTRYTVVTRSTPLVSWTPDS